MQIILCVLAVVMALTPILAVANEPAPPRIAVRDGGFVSVADDGTIEPFYPRGFNYVRLQSMERAVHWNFTGDFDPEAVDAALADMAERGFNVVRVFIFPWPGPGIIADRADRRLSPAYLNNVMEFLRIARRRGLYVVFAMDGPPPSARYRELAEQGPEPPFGGRNLEYLHPPAARAKAQYMADFADAIRQADPTLLPVVLSYELENEIYLDVRSAPFTARAGTVQLNGREYDLSDADEIQAMLDDGLVMTADLCRQAVREVDPEALVSANVFTFAAVGRSGPGAFRDDETGDNRVPARPLAMTRSTLDYIDIHLYNPSEQGLERDLQSIEWPELSAAAAEAGQPIIMGEFGSFKGRHPNVEDAVEALDAHLRRVMDLGFAGWMHWTYDTWEQNYIWHATEAEDALLDRLTELRTLGLPAPADPPCADASRSAPPSRRRN